MTNNLSGVGLVTIRSIYTMRETVSRLEQTARGCGAYVFSRIDHSGNAKHAGLALRPTELLIFGKPNISTALIQARQTAGLDVPLKVVVWRDDENAVWVTYNDIAYIALRHGIKGQDSTVAAMHTWFDAVISSIVQ